MESKKYIYALHVTQQPQRARMCGFGDEDRHSITPPPYVRLSITDRTTNREVDISMLDISFFVLTVELWDEHAQNELNLVIRPSSSSQISATSAVSSAVYAASYPATGSETGALSARKGDSSWSHRRPVPIDTPSYPSYRELGGQQGREAISFSVTNVLCSPHESERNAQSPVPRGASSDGEQSHLEQIPVQPRGTGNGLQTAGSPTCNLIGSLVASASKLHDMQDNLGIWFVLQDLSVRIEGTYRLKFHFVNLSAGSQSLLTTGSAPVLCSVFSNPFGVFSAKRFPGMIESTDLSRKFSNQGY